MRELVKATAATAAMAGLVAVGLVLWLMDWECCPHESGDE